MKPLLFIIAFTLVSSLIAAQQLSPNARYPDAELFTVNNGLSQGLVNAITQDGLGFMWFGTYDGLNRYDGYNVTVYRNNPDDSNSLAYSYILALFADSKGRLWVGTEGGGLDLFDYERENFLHFKHAENTTNSLSDNHILSIAEDANGAIWVGTRNGLNKIVIKEDARKLNSENKKAASFLETHQLSIKHIQLGIAGTELFAAHEVTNTRQAFEPGLFIDMKGRIFIRTESNYFSIRPSQNNNDTIVPLPGLKAALADEKKFSAIISITKSNYNKDLFLYFMALAFVATIDPNNGTVSLTKHFDPGVMATRHRHPFVDGELWFKHNFQLFQYLESNQQVIPVKSYKPDEQRSMEHATNIFLDKSGKIWVGTGGYGALNINTLNTRFHRVKRQSVHWFATNTLGNVIIREGDTTYSLQDQYQRTKLTDWLVQKNEFKYIQDKVGYSNLRAAIQKNDGEIWFQANGIQKYTAQTTYLEHVIKKPIRWSALYLDDEDQLWFAEDTVLAKVNTVTGEICVFKNAPNTVSADFYIATIFRDSQHIIWLGTSKGLYRFDEQKQKWEHFPCRSSNGSAHGSDHGSDLVLTICAHPNDQYLWIGTSGSGFILFNKETGACERYTVKDGLANNVVYGILTDKKGSLWMSTNNGISNFNPNSKRFTNYTEEDGLQGNEFNSYAYCKTTNGTMFFGGVSGYNYFDPDEISVIDKSSPIVITDIKSNGHSIDFHDDHSPLTVPIYLTKKLELDFKDNTISFDFSSMYFKVSAHDKYEYLLEGIDNDWISSSSNHSAIYSNLHPGNYIFKVKTAGSIETGASLAVIILSPWYLTWWFMMFIAIAVVALGYFFYRYNLNYEINRFKDHQRIASELHDEIGSTLSSIHIYSEVALNKINSKPLETATYLRQISNNVENTIGSLDDIVWALKAKDDRFEDIINRMRSVAISLCEAGGYSLQLNFSENLNDLKLGKDTRKNLFLIFKEAVNNVMKYAEGSNLLIDLSCEKKNIFLSIIDDGKGFDDSQNSNGNGLGNMRKRAKELKGKLDIISSAGKGTSVFLTFNRVQGST